MTRPVAHEPVRSSFATADQEEAREFIRGAYGYSLKIHDEQADSWRTSFATADLGAFSLTDAEMLAGATFTVEDKGTLLFERVLAGEVTFEQPDGAVHEFGPGDAFLGNHPGARFLCRSRGTHVLTIEVPDHVVDEVAVQDGESPGASVRYHSPAALPGATGTFDRAFALARNLSAGEARAAHPLVIGPAARLLAATALRIFPTTVEVGSRSHGADAARPETLRRAVAFIESNPAADISIADIGRAAFATPRAVQMAFRRHLDTTPMAYLRRVRLDCAREALISAAPDGADTVGRIALDWGFVNASWFATNYRAAYGRSPKDDLRAPNRGTGSGIRRA